VGVEGDLAVVGERDVAPVDPDHVAPAHLFQRNGRERPGRGQRDDIGAFVGLGALAAKGAHRLARQHQAFDLQLVHGDDAAQQFRELELRRHAAQGDRARLVGGDIGEHEHRRRQQGPVGAADP
jgi:hypothetical protein